MVWITPGLQELFIAVASANVFWGAGTGASDAARVRDAVFSRHALQNEAMAPVITEVVLVDDAEGVIVFVWKGEVLESHVSRLEDALIGHAVVVELWRSNREPADEELVEMAIGPPKGRLQHFMELSEVELHWQFQAAADSRLDTDDMDIGADGVEIGVEGAEHGCPACRG